MRKLLLLLSLGVLVFLSVATTLFPQNTIFWLASSASMYQHLRELLAFVLVLQLATRPPRHVWARILSGAIALAVGVWVVEATYAYQMLGLDSLSLLGASIAIGVTALERKIITPSAWLSGNKILA